jgi:hypothetical protein
LLSPKLNPAVGLLFVASQFELQPQLEVIHVTPVPDQKGVVVTGPLGGRLAHDGAILDSPETLVPGPRLPAIETRAIEDRVKPSFIIRCP